jgi:hypothetical protein
MFEEEFKIITRLGVRLKRKVIGSGEARRSLAWYNLAIPRYKLDRNALRQNMNIQLV